MNCTRGRTCQRVIGGLRTSVLLSTFVVVCLFAYPGAAEASSDYASFAAFYEKNWSPVWLLLIGLAIAVGVAVIVIAPPVGAAAGAVGSTIGGAAGLHGIAATNFGLALLGGGAVAAGGLGIAGGMGVLASAFVFTTGVATDYAAHQVRERSRFESFVDESKNFMTLPLPRSTDGRLRYRQAMEELAKINPEAPLMESENQGIVSSAIEIMDPDREVSGTRDSVRNDTMLALLHFVSNDYENAGIVAERAMSHGQRQRVVVSLPEYIFAVSLLYKQEIDFPAVLQHFDNSLRTEPGNPLAGLMYAVLLDRIHYRMNEGSLGAAELNQLAFWANPGVLGGEALPVHAVLLARYLLRLFDAQQRIEYGVSLDDLDIRDSEKSVQEIRQALSEYRSLIEGGQYVIGAISVLSTKTPKKMDELVKEAEKLAVEFRKYADDYARLAGMVSALETERAERIAERARLVGEATTADVNPLPALETSNSLAEGHATAGKGEALPGWMIGIAIAMGAGVLAWPILRRRHASATSSV